MPQLGGMTKSMVGPAVVTHMPVYVRFFCNAISWSVTKLNSTISASPVTGRELHRPWVDKRLGLFDER